MMGWGAWQWPHLALAWCALAAGGLALVSCWSPVRRLFARGFGGRLVAAVVVLSMACAGASAFYVPSILRGGPRIVDATAYWLQARIFATGHVAFEAAGPASSYRGRFLLEIRPGAFAGIFPPGYPAVLGVFHALGSPWLLGPLLAFALCALTARLAWLLAPEAGRTRATWVAALLSLACGAVRYHTADTMSHGLTMVAVVAALVAALEKRRSSALVGGALLGLVLVTRFASALALAPVLVGTLLWRVPPRIARRRAAWLVVGLAPFVVGLALYQRAVTGSAWMTPQALYYLRSDTPAGCFRYGFGAGIGCDYEHGSFVQAHLPGHFVGVTSALGTTLRRLRLHALDVASFEPLLGLVVVGAYRLRRQGRALLLAYPLLVVLAYAPFYFDGNYPGGGARFFSDALPLEHALLAVAVGAVDWSALLVVATAFVGFAIHAAPEHEKLRDRDGGVPMWSEHAAVAPLVFTNTDHGFDLGHEPGGAIDVARLRGDANDALSFQRVGRATVAWFHIEPPGAPGSGLSVRELVPPVSPPWRFEGESEWPVRALHAATAVPVDGACSGGRSLAITALAPEARVTTSLWLPTAGAYRVQLHAAAPGVPVTVRVTLGPERRALVLGDRACGVFDLGVLELRGGDQDVVWELQAGGQEGVPASTGPDGREAWQPRTFWLDALDARPEFLIVEGSHDEK